MDKLHSDGESIMTDKEKIDALKNWDMLTTYFDAEKYFGVNFYGNYWNAIKERAENEKERKEDFCSQECKKGFYTFMEKVFSKDKDNITFNKKEKSIIRNWFNQMNDYKEEIKRLHNQIDKIVKRGYFFCPQCEKFEPIENFIYENNNEEEKG